MFNNSIIILYSTFGQYTKLEVDPNTRDAPRPVVANTTKNDTGDWMQPGEAHVLVVKL